MVVLQLKRHERRAIRNLHLVLLQFLEKRDSLATDERYVGQVQGQTLSRGHNAAAGVTKFVNPWPAQMTFQPQNLIPA